MSCRGVRVAIFLGLVFGLTANLKAQVTANAGDNRNGQGTSTEKDRIILDFLRLPPEQRATLWKKAIVSENRNWRDLPHYLDMDHALIIYGQDAVPSLVAIARNRKERMVIRFYTLKLLCDMDRFVPSEDFPVPVWADVSITPLKRGGRVNPFLPVTGRRIGKEAYEFLQWASEQTDDKELQFHTLEFTGRLEEELRKLSFDEQIRQWRFVVIKSKGALGDVVDPDRYIVGMFLRRILVEKAPESLPRLLELLEKERNPYLREEIVRTLREIDFRRIRLRGTEIGRRAIQLVDKTLREGNVKPLYRHLDVREDRRKYFMAEFFTDRLHAGWWWLAFALHDLYGAQTVRSSEPPITPMDIKPEFSEFITFLTEQDPYFPSWEYVYQWGDPWDQIFHPSFKVKMQRYFDQWQKFQAGKKTHPSANPQTSPAMPR